MVEEAGELGDVVDLDVLAGDAIVGVEARVIDVSPATRVQDDLGLGSGVMQTDAEGPWPLDVLTVGMQRTGPVGIVVCPGTRVGREAELRPPGVPVDDRDSRLVQVEDAHVDTAVHRRGLPALPIPLAAGAWREHRVRQARTRV
jgi:hypothetical protein